MPETEITGLCASAGLACGEIVEMAAREVRRQTHGKPEEEACVLREALNLAGEQLQELMEKCDSASAEIIEFQLAFVTDDELSAPAFAAIRSGTPAHDAWNAALSREIAGYRASEDEYFRARISDLEDLRARVLACMTGAEPEVIRPAGSIVFATDLPPSAFLSMDWSGGGAIVLSAGSPNSHLAMLARSRGVPMVVGAQWTSPLPLQAKALVDAREGCIVVAPASATLERFSARLATQQVLAETARLASGKPAISKNGLRVQVNINVAAPAELDGLDPTICDGIGLVRTEFLFEGKSGFPDEQAQYEIYRKMLAWADGRPVVIRTLDAGADKPLPGLTIDGESNPFLGVRGIRLSLARSDVFRVQLRALLRAAVHGPLRILLPMITVPEEVATVSAMLDEELASLKQSNVPASRPPLGIMIEVPATAIAIDLFPADFYSIGSNDLTQYVMAAARDNRSLAHLLNPAHEAMLRLVERVVIHGEQTGRGVSLCGEAGADPVALPLLLQRGLRSVSVAPAAVGRVKVAIASLDIPDSGREGKDHDRE